MNIKLYFFTIILFISCKNDLQEVRDVGKVFSATSYATNLNSIYTDSGIVKSVLESPKMYNFSNKAFPYFEFPNSVIITIYDKQKNKSIITADYVISYNNTDLVDLRNNVVIATSSNDSLFTNQLYYDKSEQWLFTNYPFRFKSTNKDITGSGFDSDNSFNNINFLDVNGYVLLNE